MQLLIATRNAHKAREFRELLGDEFEICDLNAFPEMNLPAETGATFEENARLKAASVSQARPPSAAATAGKQLLVVADDSGLEVDALGGAPGILSARYAGDNATDKQNIRKLLDELARAGAHEMSKRTARFRCVLALARRGEIFATFSGVAEGVIVDLPRGSQGFGYDPIFVPKGFDKTFGQLPAQLKNQISHRARAIRALRAGLANLEPGD